MTFLTPDQNKKNTDDGPKKLNQSKRDQKVRQGNQVSIPHAKHISPALGLPFEKLKTDSCSYFFPQLLSLSLHWNNSYSCSSQLSFEHIFPFVHSIVCLMLVNSSVKGPSPKRIHSSFFRMSYPATKGPIQAGFWNQPGVGWNPAVT